MRKPCLTLIFFLSGCFAFAQNNAVLFTDNGTLFRVFLNGKAIDSTFQAMVMITRADSATLNLQVQPEGGIKIPLTIHLLDKGKPVKDHEFTYRLNFIGGAAEAKFMGMNEASSPKDPIVPVKPVIDTSGKYRNNVLAHFCEMKDGKPYYFNNIPPGKKCADPMPEGYLWYTGLLMSKVSLPEEKYRVAENVIRNNCINVAQLSNLLTYIDFEIEKLKLVRFAWPHVTDKKQGPVLEKDFRFDASLTELRKIISSAGTVPPVTADCRKPAAEEEIRSLTAQLNSVPNDQERYSTLKRSYAKYCYSAGQVKVLLLQFTHDREKLEAAKDLYFQCVEKDRFMTVAEVFSYNQTISELQQFISNQK